MTCVVRGRRIAASQALPHHLETLADHASLVELNLSNVQETGASGRGRFNPAMRQLTHALRRSHLGAQGDNASPVAAWATRARTRPGIVLSMAMDDEAGPPSRSEARGRTFVTQTSMEPDASDVPPFLAGNFYGKTLNWAQTAFMSGLCGEELRKLFDGENIGVNALILTKDGNDIVGCAMLKGLTIRSLIREFAISEERSALLEHDNDEDVVAVVSNLAVRKDKRGQGLGRELLRSVEESAEALGYHEICLMVESSNLPALQLYKSNGYTSLFITIGNVIRPGGLFFGAQKVEATFMCKRLSGS